MTYEEWLLSEIKFTEAEKEREQNQLIRMAHVGQIAAFKACLYAYAKMHRPDNFCSRHNFPNCGDRACR